MLSSDLGIGYAINAMCYLTGYEECVPVLIEAIDTFEEYNPDENYHGSASRVAEMFRPRGGRGSRPSHGKLRLKEGIPPKAILDQSLDPVGWTIWAIKRPGR